MTPSANDVTKLLLDWSNGHQEALEQLMPLVYNELRRLAEHHLQRERPDHTLSATALVHEAYLRLVDQTHVRWQNRAQFFGIAAHLMRQILVNYAHRQRTAKRGAAACKLSLDEAADWPQEQDVDLEALDDALTGLASISPQQSRIVELRFFAGLTIEETAEVLGFRPPRSKTSGPWPELGCIARSKNEFQISDFRFNFSRSPKSAICNLKSAIQL